MTPNFPARRERLAAEIAGQGFDALLVSRPENVTYLTGFTGEASFLIVSRTAQAVLVTDGRFVEQATGECPGLPMHVRTMKEMTIQAAAAVAHKAGVHGLGVEASHLTLAEYQILKAAAPTLDFPATNGLVENGRVVKDGSEIARIRAAIAVAETTYQSVCESLSADDREIDVSDRVEMLVRRHGGRGTSFPTIAAVGDRSALAHAPPTDRRVRDGQFLLLDWGAHDGLYKSDLTRMIVPHNSPSRPAAPELAELARVYAAVLAARDAAVAAIRPGVLCKDVDAAARAALDRVGLLDCFTHGLGHGIGLQVHERPALRPLIEEPLAAGMVTTVEPGVYVPGWGGVRIEDDVLVTPDGCEVLTTVPRDFDSIFVRLAGG